MLSLVYFLLLGATYTMVFWLPTLIQSWGVTDLLVIGMLAAIPNAVRRDRNDPDRPQLRQAPRAALALRRLRGASAPSASASPRCCRATSWDRSSALSFATIGIAAATPLFFTLITEYLSKAAAACGIALISSLGNLGPAVSPTLNGLIQQWTGTTAYGIYLVMAMYVLAGVILLAVVRAARPAEPRIA